MTEIEQPAEQPSPSETPKSILDAAEEKVKAIRVRALETTLRLEAEEIVSTSELGGAGLEQLEDSRRGLEQRISSY